MKLHVCLRSLSYIGLKFIPAFVSISLKIFSIILINKSLMIFSVKCRILVFPPLLIPSQIFTFFHAYYMEFHVFLRFSTFSLLSLFRSEWVSFKKNVFHQTIIYTSSEILKSPFTAIFSELKEISLKQFSF